MKPCIWRFGCVCLLLATGLSQAWAKGPEPRLVADEFQEALARISALAAVKPPEALDFPPQEARFVRVAIHETSGAHAAGHRRARDLRSRRERQPRPGRTRRRGQRVVGALPGTRSTRSST